MIAFDSTKVTFDIVRLKSITTALGGSMMVIDEDKTAAQGKEVLRRITVPMAIARDFIVRHKKVMKYLKPVYTAIAWYDNMVIDLERHPLSTFGTIEAEGFDGKLRRWVPDMETNFAKLSTAINLSGSKWYFDGRYAYTFAQDDIDTTIENGQMLTADGCFRKVPAQTFDLSLLHHANVLNLMERSCLGFISSLGDSIISPPIWKNLDDVGSSQRARANSSGMVDDDSGLAIGTFDSIDEQLCVNLNFALKAGQDIGQTFGYDYVEPLQLSRLMIELCTVNLPNVPKEIKASYPIGIQFTHTIAWLLGLLRRADTLETTIMVRGLLKYLTKRGIFRSNMFTKSKIFQDGRSVADVQLVDVDTWVEDESTVGAIVAAFRAKKPHIVLKAVA